MCDVTNKNFEEKLPEIIDNLNSASFISIDCEFSGLFESEGKYSLFDDAQQAYKKLQKNVSSYCIIQLGLSTFHFVGNNNSFSASTYNFYLLPCTVNKKLSKLTWQLGSIDFLCRYKFDFNKLFYDGISYLNKTDEAGVLKMIENDTMDNNLDPDEVEDYYNKISEWLARAQEDSELLLELNKPRPAFKLLLHNTIRKRYSNIWTYSAENNFIKLKKVSKVNRKKLQSNEDESDLKKKLFNSILGFTKIIEEIEKLQKPIVGHNILLDLMLIYKQFYNPATVSYTKFKENISKIFPSVYDTKILSFSLKRKIPRDDCWDLNSLSNLYQYFRDGKGATQIILAPVVSSKEEGFDDSNNFHAAGFDAYCTGFCFVKMAYMHLLWDDNKRNFLSTPVSKSCTTLLGAVSSMKNQLNLSRSQVKYVDLNGPDPRKTQCEFLLIQSKGNKPLNISKVSDKLAKYNSVDIKLFDKYRAVIVVSSQQHAREIRNCFKNSEEFRVTDYAYLKHSFWGRTVVGAILVSAVLGVIFTSKLTGLSKVIKI